MVITPTILHLCVKMVVHNFGNRSRCFWSQAVDVDKYALQWFRFANRNEITSSVKTICCILETGGATKCLTRREEIGNESRTIIGIFTSVVEFNIQRLDQMDDIRLGRGGDQIWNLA